MDYGSIERELFIAADPAVVYEVISSPDHITEWWPDEADFNGVVGESGTISFGKGGGDLAVVPFMVVVADPPRTFAFRWTHDLGDEPIAGNSLLVNFELVPQGTGTLVKLTETGFREMGWDAARLAETYEDHVSGWGHFLPRLDVYVDRVVSAS